MSQGESVPVQLRGFAHTRRGHGARVQQAAGSNLIVERYNPKPDSEERDAAQLDGMEPQQLFTASSSTSASR